MSENNKIRVGSRKSELALIQTKHVIAMLKQIHPKKEFEIVTMSTLGDKVLDIPLPKIGEKSLFTKELETALATGEVDFVVHSLKDLPTSLPAGMAIGAVLIREDPRDALVLQKDLTSSSLSDLPANSVVGTSSLRRTAQLALKYPHLKVESIRGNLNTRLKKLDDLGKFQAIILAAAGLIRIGWKDRISKLLETEELLYAVGQGALAVECKEDNTKIIELLEPLYDAQTALGVIAERSFLQTLGGGCSAPVAVCCDLKRVKENKVEVQLEGAVWSLDGKNEIREKDNVELSAVNGLKCSICPNNKNKTSGVEVIECLAECSSCSSNGPSPAKKAKLDLLQEDPHEKCPVQIPIGADFMGKCPYLEGDIEALKKFPLEEMVEKCPFMHNNVLEKETENVVQSNSSNVEVVKEDSSKLFVGLVPHKKVSLENLEKAKQLGKKLAEKLMEKGALKVMAAAQAIVHGQTDISSVVNA